MSEALTVGVDTASNGAILIDRLGMPPGSIDAHDPFLLERPGDPCSPIWTLCDIELASGRMLVGALRIAPPQPRPGEPPIVRATGLMAAIGKMTVDLLNGSERARANLLGWETLPVRIRLIEEPPYRIAGFSADHPGGVLLHGQWSRPLEPHDLADDLGRYTSQGW